jgi:hypothetical protein
MCRDIFSDVDARYRAGRLQTNSAAGAAALYVSEKVLSACTGEKSESADLLSEYCYGSDGESIDVAYPLVASIDELPMALQAQLNAMDSPRAAEVVDILLAFANVQIVLKSVQSLEQIGDYADEISTIVYRAIDAGRFLERIRLRPIEPLAVRGQKHLAASRKGAARANSTRAAEVEKRDSLAQSKMDELRALKPSLTHDAASRRVAKILAEESGVRVSAETLRKRTKNRTPQNRGGRRKASD